MRVLTIDICTVTEINNMAMKGPGTQGTWKLIESSLKNHKIKYDINSKIPKDWNSGHLGKLFTNMKERILDITLKNTSYIID